MAKIEKGRNETAPNKQKKQVEHANICTDALNTNGLPRYHYKIYGRTYTMYRVESANGQQQLPDSILV